MTSLTFVQRRTRGQRPAEPRRALLVLFRHLNGVFRCLHGRVDVFLRNIKTKINGAADPLRYLIERHAGFQVADRAQAEAVVQRPILSERTDLRTVDEEEKRRLSLSH